MNRSTLLVALLPLVAPTPRVTGAARIRVLSSLETLRPRDTPGGATVASLGAARGECESFQVLVHAGAEPLGALRFEAPPLGGPAGSAPVTPVLFRVAFVPLAVPSNVEGHTGPWPDPLIPAVDAFDGERRRAFPVALGPGEDAAAWVDLCVPTAARPGDYRGEVRVLDGGRLLGQVPIALRVHRFALPPTSSIAVTFGFAASTAARGHHLEDPGPAALAALARKYALAALRARISLHGGTMEPPAWSDRPDGTPALDFAAYDAEVGPFLDGAADRPGPEQPAAGARWTAVDLRVPARLEGAARAAYVRALVAHLRARGWLDRVFDYTWDEPADEALPAVRIRAEAMRAASRDVPRLVTRAYTPALDGAVDIWCPVVNLVDDKPGSGLAGSPIRAALSDARPGEGPLDDGWRARRARGERLWWYRSCLSHGCDIVGGAYFTGWPDLSIDAPPVAHRILEWLSFRYGVGGELYYNTVEGYDGDPWRDPRRHGGNGDGTLFYPGRPETIGGTTQIPVESIRLKRLRDGLEDYEYLRLYAAIAPDAARALARRIAPRTFRWEHDPERLLAAREAIARALDEATPTPAP